MKLYPNNPKDPAIIFEIKTSTCQMLKYAGGDRWRTGRDRKAKERNRTIEKTPWKEVLFFIGTSETLLCHVLYATMLFVEGKIVFIEENFWKIRWNQSRASVIIYLKAASPKTGDIIPLMAILSSIFASMIFGVYLTVKRRKER